MDPPEEVVRKLDWRRRLERLNSNAAGIRGAYNGSKNSILSRSVSTLQYNEKRTTSIGVENVLKLPESLENCLDLLLQLITFRERLRGSGVLVAELDSFTESNRLKQHIG